MSNPEMWHRGVVAKLELRFCVGSYPAHGVSEIYNGEDL